MPATETEVLNIQKLFKIKNKSTLICTHKQASEEFVKSGELAKYRYVHIATHGFVNSEKPELSGILLAQNSEALTLSEGFTTSEDGILYSGEIYNLKLNSDLVVLSACETGLGKVKRGEGIIGLTRALLYAGTKNIIVSLWKVSDASTSVLMENFYKNLLEKPTRFSKPRGFSNPLRKAKLQMIENGGVTAHPFYWSPFILVGK